MVVRNSASGVPFPAHIGVPQTRCKAPDARSSYFRAASVLPNANWLLGRQTEWLLLRVVFDVKVPRVGLLYSVPYSPISVMQLNHQYTAAYTFIQC
jgi:hypothetical protein